MLHIELRKWADLLIIAPLSANSLAKAAQGLCDNCLTSVVRAWDFTKPLLVSLLLASFLTVRDSFRFLTVHDWSRWGENVVKTS